MSGDRFVVVELSGSGSQAVGFVEGFRLGSGHDGPVWFAGREELGLDGFLMNLREKLHLELHAVMTAEFAGKLTEAIENAPMIELKVTETTEVTGAELGFKFKCFSREQADEVRTIIHQDLPEGVELLGYEEEESVDPEAKGFELYAPTHEYVLVGKGRYAGGVPGVIAIAHRLDENDFIHPEKIQLNPAE